MGAREPYIHEGWTPRASASGSPSCWRRLSLGIDLGFGQPMEHVLRQCRIALRIGRAGRPRRASSGRPSTTRRSSSTSAATPTPTSRRKWFGDDIAMKATKYELRAVQRRRRAGHAAAARCSGGTPLHRIRVGVDFALSGRKEVDGMIAAARRAGPVAGRGARPRRRRARRPGRVLRALGRQGLARRARRRRASRSRPGSSQLAEFLEVAHRTGGDRRGARALGRRRSRHAVRPRARRAVCADAEKVLRRARRARLLGRGDRRRAGAHARAVGARSATTRWPPSPTSSTSSRPTRSGTRRRSPSWPRPRPPARPAGGRVRLCTGPGWCTASAGSACPTRSGTSPARWRRRVGTGRLHPLPHRADAPPVGGARTAGRARRCSSAERLDGSGYPRRPRRPRSHAGQPGPGHRRRLPDQARAPAAPGRAHGAARRHRPAGRRARRPARRRRVDAVLRVGRHARPASPRAGPAGLTAREVEVLLCLVARPVEPGDRRTRW